MTRPDWFQAFAHVVVGIDVLIAAFNDYPAFYIGMAVLVTLIRIEARLFPGGKR